MIALRNHYIANIFAGACAESSAESSSEWKNSVKEAARNLVTAIKSAPMPPPPPDSVTQNILLAWMQPVSWQIDSDLCSVDFMLLAHLCRWAKDECRFLRILPFRGFRFSRCNAFRKRERFAIGVRETRVSAACIRSRVCIRYVNMFARACLIAAVHRSRMSACTSGRLTL